MKLGRRKMIRAMGWLVLIPLAGTWDFMVMREKAHDAKNTSKLLLADIPEGISFYPDYWISRNKSAIKVYSTRCSHLGCKVKPSGDGRLICPCHGSAFNPENGSVLSGPAQKSLDVLNYVLENDHITIMIN